VRGQEAWVPFNNGANGTVTGGALRGGKYAVIFTGTGTVDIKRLALDGTTYQACGVTQITATAGYQVLDLPPGQYEAIIATFTANYLSVVRIPGE
jgi:hypothetical protein